VLIASTFTSNYFFGGVVRKDISCPGCRVP